MIGIAHDSKSCNLGGVKVGLDNAHAERTNKILHSPNKGTMEDF